MCQHQDVPNLKQADILLVEPLKVFSQHKTNQAFDSILPAVIPLRAFFSPHSSQCLKFSGRQVKVGCREKEVEGAGEI